MEPGEAPAESGLVGEAHVRFVPDGMADAIPCAEPPTTGADLEASDAWTSWGGSRDNHRVRSEAHTWLNAAHLEQLELQWTFAVPDVEVMRSQPAVAGDWLFLAVVDGVLRALDATIGCLIWEKAFDAPLISALTLYPIGDGTAAVIAGDVRAGIHVVEAARGELLWQRQVSEHELARVSGPPAAHEGTLYAPVCPRTDT